MTMAFASHVFVCTRFVVLLPRAGDADYAWKKMGKHPLCNNLLQLLCLLLIAHSADWNVDRSHDVFQMG